MIFNHIKKQILQLLPPSDCLLCQSSVSASTNKAPLLCADCHNRLPNIQQSCPVCALPLPGANPNVCGECLKSTPAFTKTVAAFHYEPPVSDFITRLKYVGQRHMLPLLCDYLSQKIESEYKLQPLPEQVIPVPLHQTKTRNRGFNQAQLIAKTLVQRLSIISLNQAVIRNRATIPQMNLDAIQRHKNMKGVFTVTRPPAEYVAIVDDVMTTGTTVTELSKQLLNAGCKRVDVWCLARAYSI